MNRKKKRIPSLLITSVLSLRVLACGEEEAGDSCVPVEVCPAPQAPVLDLIHPARLDFTAECLSKNEIQVALRQLLRILFRQDETKPALPNCRSEGRPGTSAHTHTHSLFRLTAIS